MLEVGNQVINSLVQNLGPKEMNSVKFYEIMDIVLSYFHALTIIGLLLFCFSLLYLIKTIKIWYSSGVDSDELASESSFISLIFRITLSTIGLSLAVALVIGGIAIKVKGVAFESISLDGQTLSSLFTLVVAIPAALSSALVVVALGRNQDKLVRADLNEHKRKLGYELLERVQVAEVNLFKIREAYEKTRISILMLTDKINSSYSTLFAEHSCWDSRVDTDAKDRLWEYINQFWKVRDKCAKDLASIYPFVTPSTEPGPFGSKSQRTDEKYKENLEQASIARANQEIYKIENDPPVVILNSETGVPFEDKYDVINEIYEAENILRKNIEDLVVSLREASIVSDCVRIWNHSVVKAKEGRNSELFSILNSSCSATPGHGDSLFINSFKNPSLHLICARMEEVLFLLDSSIQSKRRRMDRSKDSIDLREFAISFGQILTRLERANVDETWVANRELTIYSPPYNSMILKLEVNGELKMSNILSVAIKVIGACLPVYGDIFESLKIEKVLRQPILPESSDDDCKSDVNLLFSSVVSKDTFDSLYKASLDAESCLQLSSGFRGD